MQNDALMSLLLDPFLTFDEVVKEFVAISSPTRAPSPAHPKSTAPSRLPGAVRRPARIKVPGVPVIHHPPAIAG